MKTITEITSELASHGLRFHPRTVRRKLQAAGIEPRSTGLRPYIWPNTAAVDLLTDCGILTPANGIPSIRTLRRTSNAARNGNHRRASR